MRPGSAPAETVLTSYTRSGILPPGTPNCSDGDGVEVVSRLRRAATVGTVARMELITAVGEGVLFAAPWLVAIAWICRPRGLGLLLSEDGPSQAAQYRAFRGD